MRKYCTISVKNFWCCLFIIGLLLTMAACGSSPAPTTNAGSGITPTVAPTSAPTSAPTAAATPSAAPSSGNSITIASFTFSPASLTIKAGTKVTWTNNDSVAHTVTADKGTFDSGPLSTGQSFSFTFNSPGTYSYHCSIHRGMMATITVQ